MPNTRALRVLLDACHQMLADARAGEMWFSDLAPQLERLCVSLRAELDAPA